MLQKNIKTIFLIKNKNEVKNEVLIEASKKSHTERKKKYKLLDTRYQGGGKYDPRRHQKSKYVFFFKLVTLTQGGLYAGSLIA